MRSCLRRTGGFALATMLLVCGASRAGGEDGHDHGDEHDHGHSDVVALTAEGIAAAGIVVERAQRRALSEVARVPARIDHNREAMAHVGTPLPGRIHSMAVRLGDEVKAGGLLLVIDSPELGAAQVDYLRERAAVEAAKATVAVTKTQFARVTELRDENWIKITEWLEVQATLQREESALQLAEANMQASYSRLRVLGMEEDAVAELAMTGEVSTLSNVRAPIAGRVIEREATLGETVGPDREALLVIADMSHPWVLADVPERIAHRVAVGMHGRLELAVPGAPGYTATVDYIAPHLDTPTRSLQVRLMLDDPSANPPEDDSGHAQDESEESHDGHDHAAAGHEGHDHGDEDDHAHPAAPLRPVDAAAFLRPGVFAQLELELAGGVMGEPVVAVPDDAVQMVEGHASVFVPGEAANTFVPREVTVGPRVGKMVPVRSGLNEGDAFVAVGAFVLKAELSKEGVAHEH